MDSVQVEAFLFDGYDDITKGLLNYNLYDSTCNTLYGTVIKYGNPTASIIEKDGLDFKFTNPVGDNFYFTSELAVSELWITDLSGKVIRKPVFGSTSIDFTDLTSGLYFIRFNANNQHSSSYTLIKL